MKGNYRKLRSSEEILHFAAELSKKSLGFYNLKGESRTIIFFNYFYVAVDMDLVEDE